MLPGIWQDGVANYDYSLLQIVEWLLSYANLSNCEIYEIQFEKYGLCHSHFQAYFPYCD